jgi:hypothetical protein
MAHLTRSMMRLVDATERLTINGCESVTSDCCAIPTPVAVLASRGRSAIVRRRETVQDLVDRFSVPDWLD